MKISYTVGANKAPLTIEGVPLEDFRRLKGAVGRVRKQHRELITELAQHPSTKVQDAIAKLSSDDTIITITSWDIGGPRIEKIEDYKVKPFDCNSVRLEGETER